MNSSHRDGEIADSWQRTLGTIPTLIGRVAYLASLRNINTGKYEHFGLAQRLGGDEADQLLRQTHMSAFQEWLCYSLMSQKEELEEYLAGLNGDRSEILGHWLTLEPYNTWVPGDSRDVERNLFHNDLGVVLEMLRSEYGVASRDPDS